jgi:hypothetical protein
VQKTGDGLRAKHGAVWHAVGGEEGCDAELKAPQGTDGLGNARPRAARHVRPKRVGVPRFDRVILKIS